VLHQADRMPHMNLELISNAPLASLTHYRQFGMNAALYARRQHPEPVAVPFRGEALGARFHVDVAILYAIETALVDPGATPVELDVAFQGEWPHG
jgi:propanediol dehydratase large subunit